MIVRIIFGGRTNCEAFDRATFKLLFTSSLRNPNAPFVLFNPENPKPSFRD